MTYSIIQKSKLEGAKRLDAEFYCSPRLLDSIDFYQGKEVSSKIQYGTSKGLNEEKRGYPTLRLNEFEEYFSGSAEKYCDLLSETGFEDLKLAKGDVLICRTNGNPKLVGKAALVVDGKNQVFASYLFKVRTDKTKINPETLVVFLNSKFGRSEIEKFLMPSIQSNFSPAQFREIKIPKFSLVDQEQIRRDMQESYSLLENSKSLYQQAEGLLLEELGLKDFEIKDELSNIINFSDVKNSNRIDAEYYQAKFDNIFEKLLNKSLDKVENHFEVIRSKNFEYTKKDKVGVIKTKQLRKQYINFEVEDWTSKEILEKEKLPVLKDKDAVFASMGVGSLGKTNIFYEFEHGGTFTTDSTLKIFRAKDNSSILPEVLKVFFSSSVGQELIYKYTVGTSGIISIYENYLKNFQIPILPQAIQQKIADLVKKSHEARKKSKELLEKAKQKVAALIERTSSKGGKI